MRKKEQIKKILLPIWEIFFYGPNIVVRTVLFSDSILLITGGDTPAHLNKLILSSAHYFKTLFQMKVPAKGAISHGKFYADFDRRIFVGQPIVDAYHLQEDLFMYSLILHNTTDRMVMKFQTEDGSYYNMSHHYKTPFQKGTAMHYHVPWLKLLDFDHDETLDHFYGTLSGGRREYVDNTRSFILELKEKII